ncbi:MAG: HlyD family efflux transporter periplasmic adaptor subunit [Anaerolineales bacterium]|jgi:HlyD family secretion protein
MHKPQSTATILLLIALMLAVTGCALIDRGDEGTPQIEQPVIVDGRVIADGVIIPEKSILLAFPTSGEVVEVLVEEGDQVSQGDILATLGNSEALLAERQAVALELLVAQQALDDVNLYAEVERERALQDVLEARLLVVAAQEAWDAFDQDEYEEDLEDAREDTLEAQKDLDEALAAFSEVEDLDEDNRTRQRRLDDVEEARVDYHEALAEQERLEVTFERLESNLAAAQAQLTAAEAEYADREVGPDMDLVAQLAAQISALEASLSALDAALDDLSLTSPFAATVVRVDTQPGEIAVAGVPVVTLADLSTWYVETDDLTELEVVRIEEGQAVSLIPEALPEETLNGVVEHIDQAATVWQGDITYSVRIRLEETALPLRWGMSVTAYFEQP